MKFKCVICNYETTDKSNYNRHIKSLTHSRAIDVANIAKYHKHAQLSKEQLECIELKKQLEEYQKQMILKDIEMENKIKDIKINHLTEQVKELKSFITSGKLAPTYNISIKKYVQQNYSEAPALESIKDYDKLEFEDNDFIETLVFKYNNECLHKYLGDFLISYYKKEDPTKQSLWNSDVSRLTYVIKELLSNNLTSWNSDYKGLKTKNYVINPLLKYIKNCINEYWIANIDSLKSIDTNTLIRIQQVFIIITKIKKDIDNGSLSDCIVRYIAPHFYLDKIDSKLLDFDEND